MLKSHLLLLFLFGGLGALARFTLVRGLTLLGWNVPWGIALINVLGCLGFGFVTAFLESRNILPSHWNPIILTGFFGAFTTFSTYIFDIQTLITSGRWITALSSFITQNTLGLTAMILGIRLGR